MNRQQINDSLDAIEQMWEAELGVERRAWGEVLVDFDHPAVAAALLELFHTMSERPSIDEIVAAATAKQEEFRKSRPDPERVRPAVPLTDDLEPWVKAWVVARYRHDDWRVFPQQKVGYDALQFDNPHYRDYVWPDQEHMPQTDVDGYLAEAKELRSDEIFRLIEAMA